MKSDTKKESGFFFKVIAKKNIYEYVNVLQKKKKPKP